MGSPGSGPRNIDEGQRRGPTWLTGWRVVVLGVAWLALIYLAAPAIGLYYEALAAVYVVPILVLIDMYAVSHPSRATLSFALVATIAAVLILGVAMIIPKGSAV